MRATLARSALLCVLAALLLGCPPPTLLTVVNGSGTGLDVCFRWCRFLEAGEERELRVARGMSSFTLRTADWESEYAIEPLAVWHLAWRPEANDCQRCPRFVVRVQPDMSVVLVSGPGGRSEDGIPTQPEGFPLLPETPR